jgi:hypothetical protein
MAAVWRMNYQRKEQKQGDCLRGWDTNPARDENIVN